ncbi:MAG: hypothetical protein HXY38_14100 [Chloroflexi bacterium]|nr:hypothetical protein [Chloroflexota bacterium]
MTLPKTSIDNVLRILLSLSQYPILSSRIRHQMRKMLYSRGIVRKEAFEEEVKRKAIESQALEGIKDPMAEESNEVWQIRISRVKDSLTDFYFAYNLPYSEFEDLVKKVLAERGTIDADFVWVNPELAPQDLLFEQAEMIENMPDADQQKYEARLQAIIAVLIRTMISDQLKYIKLARQWFTVKDLREINRRKIGGGKIGGKAAGMLLAMRILQKTAPPEIRGRFRLPNSYYLGSDVYYNFMALNDLGGWNGQKYKTEEQMRADYPLLREDFHKGKFPPDVIDSLQGVLEEAGQRPLIVRSSSLLEDNFGTSFAGKYESIFLPNQGPLEDRLSALTDAIAHIYSSVMNPDVLIYRHTKELADYDERIAILIQIVEGEQVGQYYFPHAAGVAFSRNLYRWSPQIKQDEGFLRLVCGLGTRAVDMLADDYPRLVALSHPRLHSSSDVRTIKRYSQQNLDAINIETNTFVTIPVREAINADYGPLRYIAQVEQDGYLAPILSRLHSTERLVLTFDGLLSRTPFPASMRTALKLLETHYGSPVDTEFTVEILNPDEQPDVRITLLQCRPQSHIHESTDVQISADLEAENIIFSSETMVPQGVVKDIEYVLFVPSEGYFSLETQSERTQLERSIGKLNSALKGRVFIAVGPGRWGTSTPDLGVHISYSDIYNSRALVELAGEEVGASPEPSFGTHFFQDLMEASIYPLGVFLDEEATIFKKDFFYGTRNRLNEFITVENPRVVAALKLIAVGDYRPNARMDLIMDANKSRAVAFLHGEAAPPKNREMITGAIPSSLE